MIKVETESGGISIEVRGELAEILADLTLIMREIYENIDKDLQEIYLECISKCIPNLIRCDDELEEEEEEEVDEDALLNEAAELAMKLLKWKGSDL